MPENEEVDTKYLLKSTLRGMIFDQDPILRKNLIRGTQILHSDEYPTQVFHVDGTKYIRINSKDILDMDPDEVEDNLTTLTKTLLSMDEYVEKEGAETPELSTLIEDAIEEYRNTTGEDLKESSLYDFDEFNNIQNIDEIPIKPKVIKMRKREDGTSEPDPDADDTSPTKDDDDMTKDAAELAKATGMTASDSDIMKADIPDNTKIPGMQEVEQSIQAVEHVKRVSPFHRGNSILNKDEVLYLNYLTKRLLKAFQGYGTKQTKITPRKRLNTKALAMDRDRIYEDKNAPKGKHIKLNLLIDMSGSMSGDPMKNAVSLNYIFNELAIKGYFSGSIIYSSTGASHELKLPALPQEILSLSKTGGSEGLAQTIEQHSTVLRHTNLICITDGDIVDRPIDPAFWEKNRITSTGVYINPGITDVLEYSGKLNKWFNHSLVRANLTDMIDLLVRIGIKG